MTRGKFIVLEGADGAGHTTQAHALAARLGMHIVRQPTEHPIGRLIHEKLTGRDGTTGEPFDGIHASALPLLFAADRLDHVERWIRPELAADRHVVCDRYALSNLVYAGAGATGPFYTCLCGWTGEPGEADGAELRGRWARVCCPRCTPNGPALFFGTEVLRRMAAVRALEVGILVPDLTIVLSVPPDLAARRRAARGAATEHFETDPLQARVCALYARASELAFHRPVRVVDGMDSIEVVAARVWAVAQPVLDGAV